MRSLILTTLASILLAAHVAATPTVSVHWTECPFPANESFNRNAGTGPIETITVTVKGLSGPVRGAQVWLAFGAQGPLPDAWRYDDEGCEAHRLTMSPGVVGGSCPPLDGANPREITRFDYDPLTEKARLVFARAYDGFVADPSVTYTLGRFTFDHSAPDPCACLEAPVCIHMINASWVDADLVEYVFAVEREFLTWNDPANTTNCPSSGGDLLTMGACVPTPAASMTWGRVKASYR